MPARLPLDVLKLNGTTKENPGKYAARLNGEPRPVTPIPDDAPPHFTALQAACWHELVRNCRALYPGAKVLHCDAISLEMAARALHEMRYDYPTGGIPARIHDQLYRFFSDFGLTPLARSRLTVPNSETPTASPFDEFTQPAGPRLVA